MAKKYYGAAASGSQDVPTKADVATQFAALPPGTAATVAVGTVVALPSGALPTINNSGTASAATFNFGIPAGAVGAAGTAALHRADIAMPGNATVGINQIPAIFPEAAVLTIIGVAAGTYPTGAPITIDILMDGSSVLSSLISLTNVPVRRALTVSVLTGSALRAKIVSVGTTIIGADLAVTCWAIPGATVAPSITLNPNNASVATGTYTNMYVAANGAPTPTFQWQQYVGSVWTNVSGAVGTAFTVLGSASTAGQYRAIATNSAGSAISGIAVLTVSTAVYLFGAEDGTNGGWIAGPSDVGPAVATAFTPSSAQASYKHSGTKTLDLYFDGTTASASPISGIRKTISGLTPGTSYTFSAWAVDPANTAVSTGFRIGVTGIGYTATYPSSKTMFQMSYVFTATSASHEFAIDVAINAAFADVYVDDISIA